MVKELPINKRIVKQLAGATVKNLLDALVELITNSDDSYRRLEERGNEVGGEILIYVNRRIGGTCEKLVVKDFAEGMTKEELEKAIEFAGETSGFEKGKSVRGLFGRGLKETIIALGEGKIRTVKNGKLYMTRLWYDETTKTPLYDDEQLYQTPIETSEKNGTTVDITITNERIKIPEYEKFKEQLSKHYALRDIMASNRRKTELIFDDLKQKSKITTQISFSYYIDQVILEKVEKDVTLPKYNDKAKIVIYESLIPLDSPRNNPFGLAGILIKTKGAILDNQLFKFENDPAAHFFYGEVICNGLEERLRKGETEIIDPNRGGLEWRHDYCQALEASIEKVLEPLILKKRKELEKKPEKEVKEPTKKMLRKLCSLLNELAKKEFEEVTEVPVEPEPDITGLLIKPEAANIQKGKPHTFSIYAPTIIVNDKGNEVHVKSDTVDIQPLTSTVKLEKHPKYPNRTWYRYFKVVGKSEGAEGTVTVTLGGNTASTKIKVAPPKERKQGVKLTGRKGGFISDIKPDELELPTQRTFYDKETGIIKIFLNFPSVAKFIKSGLEGVETEEGKILLAELVGEAFCRELARQRLETNPPIRGGEIDAFNDEVNKIQKRTLHKIQEIIFAWKFKAEK